MYKAWSRSANPLTTRVECIGDRLLSTEHRLVHGDVRPQNMLLRAEDDRLLLADFGVAQVLSAAAAAGGRGEAIGTPPYMAPEQLRRQVVPASDIYALGCVLFELLTGAPPYTGPPERVLYAHLHDPV